MIFPHKFRFSMGENVKKKKRKSKLKKFIKDILSKTISEEKDMIEKFKPIVDEYNRVIEYNTTKEETDLWNKKRIREFERKS